MKGLLKKFRENKKGFTLAELLVVVAIVAILVAISGPIFTSQLGKARRATNNANLRAAKVAAIAAYMTDSTKNNGASETYKYDLKEGTVAVDTLPKGIDEVEINSASISTTKVYDEIFVKVSSRVVNDKAADADSSVSLYAK